MKKYTPSFYQFTEKSGSNSAESIISLIQNDTSISSVLDVGCANGTWLAEWTKKGVLDIYGLDGINIEEVDLKIDVARFKHQDLSQPFNLGRTFDLTQSLEVAEHIDKKHAKTFINSICKHSNFVLFSAATPGQGGDHHVNEQPFEYWRDIFKEEKFSMHDPYRQKLAKDKSISFWYRYNLFIFIRDGYEKSYPSIIETRVPADKKPQVIAPLGYKLRCGIVKLLPKSVIHQLAALKRAIEKAK